MPDGATFALAYDPVGGWSEGNGLMFGVPDMDEAVEACAEPWRRGSRSQVRLGRGAARPGSRIPKATISTFTSVSKPKRRRIPAPFSFERVKGYGNSISERFFSILRFTRCSALSIDLTWRPKSRAIS